MKHKLSVEKYEGELESLAHDIGNLRYDSLAKFLEYLSKDFEQQSLSDGEKGRTQLSAAMLEAATSIKKSKSTIDQAWKISEPYMKD